MDLTPDQIEKLKSLGIETPPPPENTKEIPVETPRRASLQTPNLPSTIYHRRSVFPLLSISGLTLLSFGGMILFKTKNQAVIQPQTVSPVRSPQDVGRPTQVPKSIQHYLLASQQYFSQALQNQNSSSTTDNRQPMIESLNQSILAATEAIKEFPQDFRGYQQRGKIYQSLIDSQPQLLTQAITDLTLAQKYNPSSAEITHDLASLFAKKGDSQNTLVYLVKTVALEPTKAQNFYDLAKIQQQAGLIPQALDTYNRLLPLVTDPTQKTQIESEKTALEQLLAQNPSQPDNSALQNPSPTIYDLPSTIDSPTIQATDITNNTGLIIAAPETSKKIEVANQTDSNALVGNVILPANQKEITINNSNLISASQIYITPTNKDTNYQLKVLSRSGSSFVIGLDSPATEDIEFKWWIINK